MRRYGRFLRDGARRCYGVLCATQEHPVDECHWKIPLKHVFYTKTVMDRRHVSETTALHIRAAPHPHVVSESKGACRINMIVPKYVIDNCVRSTVLKNAECHEIPHVKVATQ